MSNLVMLAVALAVSTFPAPGKVAPASYFPLKVGTRWEYQVTGDRSETITQVILSVEKDGAAHLVTLSVVYEEFVRGTREIERSQRKVRVEKGGIFALSPWPDVLKSEICLLKTPATKGAQWSEDHPAKSLKRVCTVFESEPIKVPAGEYEVIRVKTLYIQNGKNEYEFSDDWYSPGIGLVKQQRRDISRTLMLKAFTTSK